jgi:hypothetical protein
MVVVTVFRAAEATPGETADVPATTADEALAGVAEPSAEVAEADAFGLAFGPSAKEPGGTSAPARRVKIRKNRRKRCKKDRREDGKMETP